jgi:DNA-binding NarL/FixJ family response regulator
LARGTRRCDTAAVAVSCLLVDDSREFLESATRLLEAQGMRIVGWAMTGEEARTMSDALRPDIVLVDVELGEEDGIEVARSLTSGDAPSPVILISLRDWGDPVELVATSGAIAFLRKDRLGADTIAELLR